jgi:DNA polymerase III sliding clamp (beta) subunit (PCNA family)
MKIDKRVGALIPIAKSSDKFRGCLTGINFNKGKAAATDGFRLLVITLDNDFSEIPEGWDYVDVDNVTLDSDAVSAFVKDIPSKQPLPVLNTGWSSKSSKAEFVRLVCTDLKNTIIRETKVLEGTYPKFESVLSDSLSKKPLAVFKVNPTLLAELLLAMVKAGAMASHGVTFRVVDGSNGIYLKGIDGQRRDVIGLIMPMNMMGEEE